MRNEDLNVSPLMVAEYNETTSMKVGRDHSPITAKKWAMICP